MIAISFCNVKKEVASSNGSSSNGLSTHNATKSVMNFSNVVWWKKDQTPKVPQGFTIHKYEKVLKIPDGCMCFRTECPVAESNSNHPLIERIGPHKSHILHKSVDRVTLLCDRTRGGIPAIHEIFLEKLNL